MVNLTNLNSRATLSYVADPWSLSQLRLKEDGFSPRTLRRSTKQSFNNRSIRKTSFRQIKGYNPFNGYGQIDAQQAFERLLGRQLKDQTDLGGYQWNLDQVNAPEVWASGATGAGVTIAVIDSGIDLKHHEFRGRISAGIDFVDRDYVPQDLNGHGTHVAGTLAAANDGIGITGVAHQARLMPIRVLDDDGVGSISDVISGIRWAANNGADVINLSLGGDVGYSQAMEDAIWHASKLGSVVVMASGNSGRPSPAYPAAHATDHSIAVGAVNRFGQMANFSNRAGHQPLNYVTAPGVDIASTYPGNRYALASGTSMSTPHVAGVAALLKGTNKRLSPAAIEHLVTGTAKNSSFITLKSDTITGRKRQDNSVITLKNLDNFSEDMLQDPLIGSLRGNYKQRQNTTGTISSQINQQSGNFVDIQSFKTLDPIQNLFAGLEFSDTSTGDRKDLLRKLLNKGFNYFEIDQNISI
jgi:subtilisin family serine protease